MSALVSVPLKLAIGSEQNYWQFLAALQMLLNIKKSLQTI